jgi:CBS domain-containing protein
MQVKDIMSSKIEWISPDASVTDAAKKMRELNVGSLPVQASTGDGQMLGIVTDRDITCRVVAAGLNPTQTKVTEMMTKSVASCFSDQDIGEATRLMETKQVHRLPVIDRQKHVIGMLALADIATHAPNKLTGEVIEAISRPGA